MQREAIKKEKTIFILGRQIDTHKIGHRCTSHIYDEFVFYTKQNLKKDQLNQKEIFVAGEQRKDKEV